MRILKLYVLCCAVVLAVGTATAQRMDEPPPDLGRRSEAMFEAVQVLNRDTSRATLYIQYRIPHRFFTFTRTQSAQGLEEFEATGEVSVEILDAQKFSVAREFRPIRIVRPFQPRENERLPDLQGVIPFVVPSGTYRAVTEVRDSQSGRDFANRSVPLTIPQILATQRLSSPMLVDEPRTQSGIPRFLSVNRARSVLFGAAGGCLIHVLLPDINAPATVTWELKGTPADWYFLPQTLRDSAVTIMPGTPVPTAGPDGIAYTIIPDSSAFRTVYIPLPLTRLGPATYTVSLSIVQGKTVVRHETSFDVVWPMRPFSLTRFDLAVDALKHTMSGGELDTLKSESTADAERHFRAFWQKQNSDTTRAFNPALIEYYRRVDEAIRQFSGPNDRMGYSSDQGRVLILFGTPSRVERSLKPGTGRTIVWTYTHLRKAFTFSDAERRDFFVLVRVDDL